MDDQGGGLGTCWVGECTRVYRLGKMKKGTQKKKNLV